jgi:multidrug efflux pump subunit AcrB
MLRFLVTRPIAVLLSTLGFVILGLVVLNTLPISLLPEVPIPQITVQAASPGMAAREMENTVTRPLRLQLMQVGRLKDINSRTRNGAATITLEFEPGANTGLAFIEVNEKIDQITGSLPPDLERPRVLKANITDIPVFYLSVSPKDNPAHEGRTKDASPPSASHQLGLAELAQNTLRRRIEQLPEVAFVDQSGYAEPEVVITPNEAVFQSLHLTEGDLASILQANDLDLGSMLVQDGHYQYNIRFRSGLKSVDDIRQIYFRHEGRVLQLQEVAGVSLQPRQRRGLYLHDGREAVVFSVRKQAQAQLFALKASFGKLLEELRRDFPQLEFAVTNDQSELLEVSVQNLGTSLQWGALFAVAVLFLFFRGWRRPLLIAVVIPVSLIVALFGFYLTGMSVNVISLSGLILGVGLMIDNGIIVMDNIRQYRRMGFGKTDACVSATEEVIRPLISSALTTCAVFVPLVFLSGTGGALFKDQALSVTLALGASLFVAWLLLPTLLNLGKTKPAARGANAPQVFEENAAYRRSAAWVLSHRCFFLFCFAILTGGLLSSAVFLKKETFPPLTRQGAMVQVDWNEPVSLEESRGRLLRLTGDLGEAALSSDIFAGEQQFLLAGEEQGLNEAKVILYGNQAVFSEKVPAWFRENYPAASAAITPLKTLFDEIFGSNKAPLTVHLQQINSAATPAPETAAHVIEALHRRGFQVRAPPQHEQYEAAILREEALLYGVPYRSIYDKLHAVFNQHQIGILRSNDRHIPIVTATGANALQPLLSQAQVQNGEGDYLPLKTFIHLQRSRSPKTLTAGKTGESLDLDLPVYTESLPAEIRQIVARSGELTVHFSGQVFDDEQTLRELSVILGISLLLLYLILAAQFESLVQPVIVLLTVPAGMAGALFTLWLTGQSLNIVSAIGLIVSGGIVVNDAILKVDMMNRLSANMPLREAIHLAGARRLKPIVMTSATTILALLPVLFSGGLGAELQRPLAWAVCGGLFAGTAASLYFVPVLYSLLTTRKAPRP